MFAAARAGLVLVNLNPAYRTSELEFALRLVGCRALVFARHFKGSDYAAMLQGMIPELPTAAPGCLVCAAFPGTAPPRAAGHRTAGRRPAARRALLQGPAGRGTRPRRNAGGVARTGPGRRRIFNIQFTSGTTGTPKGAALTHFNIVNNGFFVGEGMRLTDADRVCIPVPLYHCFGMVLGVLAAMTHGAASVFPSEASSRSRFSRPSHAERCTVLHGVPTMFIAELEHPRFGEFDLSSLRTGIMAGSPCPIAVMRRVVDRDAHARGHDLLRHDRNQPRQFPERPRRPARTARQHGRPDPSARAGQDHRRRWAHDAARHGRASC